ncbi:unnamed protein product, partial [Owenia fusiformis]
FACLTELRTTRNGAKISKKCQTEFECSGLREKNANLCFAQNATNSPVCSSCCVGIGCNIGVPTALPYSVNRKKRAATSIYDHWNNEEFIVADDKPAYWNGTVPTCNDVEPPVFTHCPKELNATLTLNGPLPVDFVVPTATDNSGITPTITSIPAGIQPPYVFEQDGYVVYVATDSAGNQANCTIKINHLDGIPPRVQCPQEKVVDLHNTTSFVVPARFPDVIATDNVGVVRVVYDPPNGTIVQMRRYLTVTVTAYDEAGNQGACSFNYEAIPAGCPEWSLQKPENGDRSCSATIGGATGTGFSCNVRCPRYTDFVTDPALQYICVFGGTWEPHNYVPDCTNQLFPGYALDYFLQIDTGGPVDMTCLELYMNATRDALLPILDSNLCDPYAKNFAVNIERLTATVEGSVITISLRVLITVVDTTGISPNFVAWCGTQISTAVQAFNPGGNFVIVINSGSCPDGTVQPPVTEENKEYVCPAGHIFRGSQQAGGYCLMCLMGTYANQTTNECIPCPKGQYNDEKGLPECKACPEGTSTLDVYSRNVSECI